MSLASLAFSWCFHPGRPKAVVLRPPAKGPRPGEADALHGATMNGWFSGLNKKADEAGFIVL